MGLAASQARLLELTIRSTNLEFQAETISEKRMQIAEQTEKLLNQEVNNTQNSQQSNVSSNEIFSSATSIIKDSIINYFKGLLNDPQASSCTGSDSSNTLDKEIAKLEEEDKKLEMQLNQIDTQHKAVQTETESVQKVIDKNIEETFKNPE